MLECVGRRQTRNQQVGRGREPITGSDHHERAYDIPVGEHAPEDCADQDGGDGRGLEQAVCLNQAVRRSELGQNPVLRWRIRCGANANEAVREEGVETQAHRQRAGQLERIGDEHHATLGQRVGERADERREQDVSGNEELLQDGGGPVRIVIQSQQSQCAEQQSVVGQRRKELRDEDADHSAGPERGMRKRSVLSAHVCISHWVASDAAVADWPLEPLSVAERGSVAAICCSRT